MKNTAVKWLYKHTENVHIKVLLAAVMTIITSLCTVFFALLMRGLIDHAISHDIAGLKQYSAFLVAATVVIYLSFLGSRFLQEEITVRLLSELRSYLIAMLTRKDYSELRKKHTGQWMNLLFSDIKVISEGTSSIIPGLVGMVSRLVFAFITLALLEPFLVTVYLVGGIAILIGVCFFRTKLKKLHKDVQEKEDNLHSFFQEVIENVLVIKVFGAEDYFDQRTETVQNEYSKARLKRRKLVLLSVNLFSFTFQVTYIAALVYGGYQLLGGAISYGTLTAILHIVNQMRTPIMNISGYFPKIYETLASVERIIEVDQASEMKSGDHASVFYSADFSHTAFSYGRNEVINNANLSIKKNDILALTGTSGGGKSTLFLLLLGIYSPTEGSIEIKTDKGSLTPGNETRSLFSYVPQGNSLFTGTIRDNITFNKPYDEQKLTEAMRTAEALDFVSELPEKENTRIGERGTGLSEGQIQRLAIARAIYSDAPVLLLDESTSALDEDTEAKVLNNIRLLNNKTVLIVTHRPAALGICTRHFQIEDHLIQEVGHEQN